MRICSCCGKPVPDYPLKRYRGRCLDCQRRYNREYAAKWGKANRKRYRELRLAATTKYRAKLKRMMLERFGAKCACCGETEPMFLEIDHINSDGARERRERGGSSTALRVSIHKQGYPSDRYRLLCSNCNHGRARNGGVCPHEVSRAACARSS